MNEEPEGEQNKNLGKNLGQIPAVPENMRTKKNVWVVVVAFVVLLLIIGGWFVWKNYLNPDIQHYQQLQGN